MNVRGADTQEDVAALGDMRAVFGSWIVSPRHVIANWASDWASCAGRTFMRGEPMNVPTKRSAGLSYRSPGVSTCK